MLESGLLSKANADRTARILYDALKIVYERQKRLNKPQLKMKEIACALVLAEHVHSCAYRFEAAGELAENFGECPESKALDYYETRVIGEVTDAYGRRVRIDEDAMKSLYKEKESGRHIVESGNYEEVRGKRLPWIRHVLRNSRGLRN